MKNTPFPVGKLPVEVLAGLLKNAPVHDPRVVVGPGIGMDCAVLDMGEKYLVLKSDPITFATDEIGWYLVQVNANDIATTGAAPRWLMVTLLLPEGKTGAALIDGIARQVFAACEQMGIAVIGGHTEITYGLDRVILVGAMMGEVAKDRLVTSRGARPGDRILLTKGIPIEATAILAREFPERLEAVLSPEEIAQAQNYLHDPGISVVPDARLAVEAGEVTAMHDPTEGGLASALWELALASGHTLVVRPESVPVSPLSRAVCDAFQIDPLAAIASGALLLTAAPASVPSILARLQAEGIPCAEIGEVRQGAPTVLLESGLPLPRPPRDEIAKIFTA